MRPAGAQVRLYYDGRAAVITGDYIRTQTGRTYYVQHVRIQARGRHIGRYHLTCIVMADDHVIESDDTVHPIYWYSRRRERR